MAAAEKKGHSGQGQWSGPVVRASGQGQWHLSFPIGFRWSGRSGYDMTDTGVNER